MWQTILVIIIVACCGFLLGRRYYRQWRRTLGGGPDACIETSCCSCPSADRCAEFETSDQPSDQRG